MAAVGRNIAAPLLFLNLIMYFIVLGFASWCINRYIDGQTYHPSMGGNGATGFFLTFAILAAVVGIVSKFAGEQHIRFACKHINIGGWRGWRLRIIEAFIIILTFTQLLYILLIHAGVFSSRYGPGYRDADYGIRAPGDEPVPKTGPAVAGSRV
ncbi:hypothetical protein CRYUN_Cryun10bG0025500 [Craigia yunnanensis]